MKSEIFDINDIRYWKEEDGYFIAGTKEGVSIKGKYVIQPFGIVRVFYEKRYPDPRYGDTIEALRVLQTSDEDATMSLLEAGVVKGVRSGKAYEVMATLGEQFWQILDACIDAPFQPINIDGHKSLPHLQLERVKGIGPIVGQEMIASWRNARHGFRALKLAMKVGLNLKQYEKAIVELRGPNAFIDMVMKTPYGLTRIKGFTWADVDFIARIPIEGRPTLEWDAPTRLAAAVREAIRLESGWGHIGGEYQKVMQAAHDLAQPSVEIVHALGNLKDHGLILVDNIITTEALYKMERDVAVKLRQLQQNGTGNKIPQMVNPQDFCEYEMDPKQKLAVLTCLYNGAAIITGGPGTGKTTTVIDVLLKIFHKCGISFALCAPTGIAAIRIRDTSGKEAGTIHRTFNLAGEIPSAPMVDYIIVDETSMMDGELQAKFSKLMGRQRIIFIGDPDQLPPVGNGFPLVEMMPHIPHVHLTKVYRQGEGSGIITACHQINKREWPGDYPPDQKDFQIFYARQHEMADMAIRRVEELIELGVSDILVLSPVRGKYDSHTHLPLPDGGRNNLNHRFKAHFNPHNEEIKELGFALGDPVIETVNNYELTVMNGQIGRVRRIDNAMLERSRLLPRQEGREVPFCHIIFDKVTGEKIITINDADDFELAYCVTIHKAQGNQATAVLFMMPPTFSGFYMKQLPYTAASRGVKYSWVVTPSKEIFMKYLINDNSSARISLLGKFLAGNLR